MRWRPSLNHFNATKIANKPFPFAIIPLNLALLFAGLAGCRSLMGENNSDTLVSTCIITPAMLKANTCANFQKAPLSPCYLRLHGYSAPDQVLKAVDSDLKEMGWKDDSFTRSVQGMAHILAPQETRSITYYTLSGYKEMNRGLRGDEKLFKNHSNMIYAAASGLNKLEKFEGIVYRSENVDLNKLPAIEKAFKVGGIVVEEVFLSTTKRLDNNHAGGPGVSQLYIAYKIHSKTGRDIESLSMIPQEKEVLFAPGSTFRILSFNKEMEEAWSPQPEIPAYMISLKIELEEIVLPD